jgi:hypothetical protein
MTESLDEPVAITNRNSQIGVSNGSGGLDAADRFLELQADAAVAIGGEGQSPIGERQMSWPGGLNEAKRPRDAHLGDVVDGCLRPPRPETRQQAGFADAHLARRGGHSERKARDAVERRERESESLLGHIGWSTRALEGQTASGPVGSDATKQPGSSACSSPQGSVARSVRADAGAAA